MPLVGVVMGSQSDMPYMKMALDVLTEMGVEHEVTIMSAHRTPTKVQEYAHAAESRGLQVIIAGAGGAAHLPGVIASWTTLPVIGVPLPTSDLKGLDALYAIVQMPAGVPVATMAVGEPGAKNAAYLATQILALKDDRFRAAYERVRSKWNK